MEALQRLHNRGSVSTGYDIDNSLKFEPDNSETIRDAHNTAGNRRELTISFWCKITELGAHRMPFTAGARQARIWFNTSDELTIQLQDAPGYLVKTNRKFRDTSAWYHFVIAIDTTQATDSNRIKLWVNGVQETSWATTQWPPQNFEGYFNVNQSHHVSDTSYYFAGYIADFFFIDDQVLQETDFGEYDADSGIWIPKKYSGTFSGQSFYLKFDNASDLDERSDGLSNGVSMSVTNITAADQATDTPTNNFATQNVIWGTDKVPLMSEGATEIGNNVNAYRYSPATMGVANGKWYWEIKPTVNGNTLVSGAGIASNQTTLGFYQTTGNFVYHYDGNRYVNGGATGYGAAWATNDIIGFAYDADNWTLTCYVNNSSQGNLLASQADISSELFIPYVYSFGTHTYQTNFGGYTTMSNTHTNTDENGYGSFVYAPPSGYYALCTKNLEEYG